MTDEARSLCRGRTKRGEACPRRADSPSGLCILHDPARADEKRAMLSVLGAAGRAKQTRRKLEATPERVPLRSTGDIRALLERAAGLLEGAAGDAVARVGVAARLTSVAIELLKTFEIEREVRELRELVRQALPSGGSHGPT